MLQKLAEQIEEVRRRVDEPTAAKLSNNYIIRQLHEGSVKIARELYIQTDDVTAFSSVNNQQGYPLPSDFIDSSDIIWQYDTTHLPLVNIDRKELIQILPQSGDPISYAIDEARKLVLLNPIPSGSAATTTLSSGSAATDSTITVNSTSAFGGIGYITIDSEIIQYTGATATTFIGCTRGACNTVAASHTIGTTVTWDDIVLYYTRLPHPAKFIRTSDKVIVTNGSAIVTGSGTNWLAGQNIYVGQYFGLGQLSTVSNNENFPTTWYKIKSVDSTTQITLTNNYSELTTANILVPDSCIITDSSEFYEQDCPIIVAWATYQCEGILNNKDKKEYARLSYNSEMNLAKERLSGPDNMNVIKRTRYAYTSGLPTPRLPSHYE